MFWFGFIYFDCLFITILIFLNNYFTSPQMIFWLTEKTEISNILWLALLTCEIFLIIYIVLNWVALSFRLLVGQNRQYEDVTFNFWQFVEQLIN